jgi:predicted GNAT family acetyltransferase
VTDFLSQHGIDRELIRSTLLEARNSPGVIPLACLKAKQKADEDTKPDT